MKKYFCFILLLSTLFSTLANGQEPPIPEAQTTTFAWTPSGKYTVVKGLAVGLNAKPWNDSVAMQVNGLNLELGPMGLVLGLWGTALGLAGHKDAETGKRISFFRNLEDSFITDHDRYPTKINGVSFSLLGLTETYNKGILINGLAGESRKTKGIQLSGLLNMTDRLDGLSVATLANVAMNANGVQIGLINNCRSGNVVQIGLFNRIGKRVTPFVNFRLRKDKKTGKENL